MDLKKVVPAIVVGYVLLLGLGYLIHEVWLKPVYQQYAGVWRSELVFRHKLWVMWVGQLIFTAMFAWIYTRGVEHKPWAGQGIRYAILMTLLAVVPTACAQYTVYPIPYTLAVKWMVGGGLQLLVLGLVVAWFCRESAA